MSTTVTISECGSDPRTWTSTRRTDDPCEAVSRAIRAVWGRKARLHVCHGLTTDGTRYGKIVMPNRFGSLDCVTGYVSVRTS